MPLEVQIKTNQYKFEIMNLPYEAQDFDFETYKSFAKQGARGKGDLEGRFDPEEVEQFEIYNFLQTDLNQLKHIKERLANNEEIEES